MSLNDGSTSAWISLALPIGMAVGAMASGVLVDKYFYYNKSIVVVVFMVLSAFLVFAFLRVTNELIALNAIILFAAGFFIYGAQTPLFSICPDVVGSELSGTAVGCMNSIAYAFAGIGEIFIGYFLCKSNNDFFYLFLVVIVASILSALFAKGVTNGTK